MSRQLPRWPTPAGKERGEGGGWNGVMVTQYWVWWLNTGLGWLNTGSWWLNTGSGDSILGLVTEYWVWWLNTGSWWLNTGSGDWILGLVTQYWVLVTQLINIWLVWKLINVSAKKMTQIREIESIWLIFCTKCESPRHSLLCRCRGCSKEVPVLPRYKCG